MATMSSGCGTKVGGIVPAAERVAGVPGEERLLHPHRVLTAALGSSNKPPSHECVRRSGARGLPTGLPA